MHVIVGWLLWEANSETEIGVQVYLRGDLGNNFLQE